MSPDAQDSPGGDALAALVAATAAWDRSSAGAELLRALLAALDSPRRRPADGRERALLKLRSVYAKRDASALGQWLLDKPEEARFIAAYIGDPRVARWPFEDALAISDLEAVTWLELFEQAAVVPTDAAREFVRVMLDTRARQTWIPASRAFAALALRCEILREDLAAQVRRQLAKGWPERWPGGRLSVGEGSGAGGASHHRLRRTVHLICAWLGRGGDPSVVGGLSPAVIASTPLPHKDDSDASIYLLGLVELLPELLGVGELVEALVDQVERLGPAPQCEEVVRELCERLERAPGLAPARARTRLLDWLTRDRWASAPTREQPASLFAWSETARWFAGRGDATALRELSANAGAASFVMELVQGDAQVKLDDPVGALLERLEVTLTPLLLETTLPERRAPLLVELVCLLQRAELAPIDWPKLVARALGPDHQVRLTPGSVGEVALADLPALLVRVGWPVAWLLRRTPMSREATLSIASSRSGLVARQVGVAMERLLREAGDGAERVRLFWQLIRRRPPVEAHRQLRQASRGDGDLDRMNDAAAGFAGSAGAEASLADHARGFLSLLDATVASLGAHEAGTVLRPVQAALRELAAEGDAAADPAALRAAPARVVSLLERVLIASDASRVIVTGLRPGLASWSAWVEGRAQEPDQADARAELASRIARVERTISSFEAALPVLEQAQIESTQAALDELEAALGHELGWPFTPVLDGLLALLRGRVDEGLREAQASRDLAVHLRGLLDRGDDEEAAAIALDAERVALLPVGLIRRLHASLLNHLHLRVAQSLRASVRERVQLGHVLTHLAPLAVGVIGGTLLVLDVGKDWIDLADDLTRSKISVTLTIVISLLASYGILLTGLTLSHKADMDEASASERGAFWKFAGRVSLVFVGAWALAWLTSTLIMLTLGEIFSGAPLATVLAKLTLWSSLSLFLGVFLGLVLQGRRLRAD